MHLTSQRARDKTQATTASRTSSCDFAAERSSVRKKHSGSTACEVGSDLLCESGMASRDPGRSEASAGP